MSACTMRLEGMYESVRGRVLHRVRAALWSRAASAAVVVVICTQCAVLFCFSLQLFVAACFACGQRCLLLLYGAAVSCVVAAGS